MTQVTSNLLITQTENHENHEAGNGAPLITQTNNISKTSKSANFITIKQGESSKRTIHSKSNSSININNCAFAPNLLPMDNFKEGRL